MRWIYVIVTMVAISLHARTVYPRTTTPMNSEYDGSDSWFGNIASFYNLPPPPFSEPGLIFGSYTVNDLLPIAGNVWNSDSIIEGGRQACRRLESDLSSYLSDFGGGADTLETVCNFFETTNVEEECGDLWDRLVQSYGGVELVNGSVSLIPDLNCRRSGYPSRGGYGTWSLDTVTLRDFNIYDPCTENGIERVNNMLFALMDWVGPSLFESVQGHGIEPYSTCGILRYLLSMDISDVIPNAIGILKYPCADILEKFHSFDICTLSQLEEPGAEAIGAFKDLLVELSNFDEAQFCSFIAGQQTRESYLEEGEIIISGILDLRHNEPSCNNVLEIIAPFDEFRYFQQITGYDAMDDSEKSAFCTLFVEAYDPSTTYVPTPYELPPDSRANIYAGDPGEVLPGLTFIDLARIDGAAGRQGEKVLDGVALYCEVFEEVLSSLIRPDVFDVAAFCSSIRHRALDTIEGICVATHPSFRKFYNDDRPLWLRPFNPKYEGIYVLRGISGIMDISKEEICPAVGNILNDVSFIDLVDQTVDIFLIEVIPYANIICENWEEAMCYWRPYCPVLVQPTADANPYYPRIPSTEAKEELNAEHDRLVSILASLASIMAGFDTPEETCTFISGGIDRLSGRADILIAERMRERIVGLLTDVGRCSRLVDVALGIIREEDLEFIFPTAGVTNVVHQITGFDTSGELCQAVAASFARSGGTVASPITLGAGASYNIFANITVYIQRVARSVLSEK